MSSINIYQTEYFNERFYRLIREHEIKQSDILLKNKMVVIEDKGERFVIESETWHKLIKQSNIKENV